MTSGKISKTQRRIHLGRLILAFVLLIMTGIPGTALASEVDFAREVLPVLSDKCFYCHGPDTKNKKDLRLDSFEAATLDLGGYQAINTQEPEKSEVLIRIFDKDDPMPPDDAEKQLTDEERDTLKKWVLSGGKYAKHWAFEKPRRDPIRTSDYSNPIDVFVSEKLEKNNLSLADKAEKSVIARRAGLVLTGLPPESLLLKDFLADNSNNAYEKFVDALIADPRFGEHQARYWLDAVRYGDTHGLHLDNKRGIYPYRDWVVRSTNENIPFDKSIQWQLAGDLLEKPTLDQLLATGYVRMNPTTAEGGAIAAEFQAKNNFDRTETFGTVFLGMTMSCARCHNHKYDPISQKEYYELLAFFNSTAEHSMDGNSYTYGPTARVPQDQTAWNWWNHLKSASKTLIAKAEKNENFDASEIESFIRERKNPIMSGWQISPVVDSEVEDKSTLEWEKIDGLLGTSKVNLPEGGQVRWVKFDSEIPDDVVQTVWFDISGEKGSHIQVGDQKYFPYTDGQSLVSRWIAVPLQAKQEVFIKMVSHRKNVKVSVKRYDPYKIVGDKGDWNQVEDINKIHLFTDLHGPLSGILDVDQAHKLANQIDEAQSQFTTSLITQERTSPRETFILRRGEYNQPIGDALQPSVIEVMGELDDSFPKNRLGLAQWITSPDHPTVARVLVNQLWLRVFGEGLVRSPEDFGLQGQQPTHPELLDWLAIEFIESGWNLKHMLKLMVTSETFLQSSLQMTQKNDPTNGLWSRGPSYRLDAEVIRDIALWASGALDDHMGGEGVKPYQPAGMWRALAHPASNTKNYVQDSGDKLYRRSLYVYWKRTSPHPMMTLFDAPSRESSCVGRSRTNTPLQSLGLLNETQRVEIGRIYASNLLQSGLNDRAKLASIFMSLTCREPSESEYRICLNLLAKMKDRYRSDIEAAKALVQVGNKKQAAQLDPSEHAAWTQVAITLLASDHSIILY